MATEATESAGVVEQDERRPTERVILEKVRVLRVPDGVTDEQLEAAAKALAPKKGKGFLIDEAWVEVARATAATKRAAIESYTGKAGTPTAKVGEFRAPPVTGWKGGLKLIAPPKPLIEAEAFE